MPNKKFRVGLIQNFPNATPDEVRYTEAETIEQAMKFREHMVSEGYQSGDRSGNPNLVLIEYYDENEQDWLFYQE